MKNKVSVLICTFNCENYIINTLNSILNQTYQDFKILICENDSKDRTREILKKFESKYPDKFKIYYQHNNLGAYGGLNYLLDRTDTKYIVIHDHDDISHKYKLQEQIEFLDNNKQYIGCGTNLIWYYEKYNKFKNIKINYNLKITYHPTIMFRNTNLRYPNKEYEGDRVFLEKLISDGEKMYTIDKPYLLYTIRKDDNNYSSTWRHKITIKQIYNNIFKKNIIKEIYKFLIPFKFREYISINIISKNKVKNIKYLKYNIYTKYYLKYIKGSE